MLAFTLLGFAVNILFALAALKFKNIKLCTYSSIAVCYALFAFFVINGGNDGFAALWIALAPFFAMTIMDLTAGIVCSIITQIFLIVVFWTPASSLLLYNYNQQFCLRFPVFFLITSMLGLGTTISLQKSQYDAQMHLTNLEKMTEIANRLAKCDPLTALANRRWAYEIFDSEFGDEAIPHSVVMGDIDRFKSINDNYGHDFGDGVLVTVANYITELLPNSYLKSRWGGEEFLIAANEPLDTVYKEIETLREKIAAHEFNHSGKTVRITITFGIAEYYERKDLSDAITTADTRLYAGKKGTLNCTVREG